MNKIEKKTHYTVEEYLALEEVSEVKQEFAEGEIFVRAGANYRHSITTVNIVAELHNATKKRDCQTFDSDMKVWIEKADAFLYPDASVVCGDPEFLDEKKTALKNPVLVVEVLSASTEAYDRGEKFQKYMNLPSLQEYVIISQHSPRVEVFRKDDGEWRSFRHFFGLDAIAELKSIGVSIPLAEIYYQVQFPNP